MSSLKPEQKLFSFFSVRRYFNEHNNGALLLRV